MFFDEVEYCSKHPSKSAFKGRLFVFQNVLYKKDSSLPSKEGLGMDVLMNHNTLNQFLHLNHSSSIVYGGEKKVVDLMFAQLEFVTYL